MSPSRREFLQHSATAAAAASLAPLTSDPRFKQRADYLVREMKEVQDTNGDGYLSALAVETKFAGWAEGALAPLSDEQVARMLNTEYGGMNEVLADLYADTGDTQWLALSMRFEHHAFTDPLKRHQGNLSGKHGNCQIPKLFGSAVRYGYTTDGADLMASSFFWDRVAQHHSYAAGGHGLAEYFGPPDMLSRRADGRTCESCNCYNMLQLTRRLFSLAPDVAYADYHERTLFNHVLASIDDTDGRTSYMVPVGRGVEQEYQGMQHDFTCCVGTGMESHGLRGYGVYYESDDTIYVNLFAPSVARCAEHPVTLEMETGFPDGDSATLRVKPAALRAFTLAVRRPHWAADAFSIKVNGTIVPQPPMAALFDAGAGGRRGAADRRIDRNERRSSRGGTGWFSYDLMVEPTSEMALVVTYFNELGLPPTQGNFKVKVEGTTIAKFEPNAAATGFYDARYAVPMALTTGKARVTVRFEALGSGRISPVYGIRVVRARDAQ